MTQTNGSSTGTAKFIFSVCKESVFGTSCQSGASAGVIESNTMVSHNIVVDNPLFGSKVVGILLTGPSITFKCPSVLATKTVTGNIIGEIENPNCGQASNKTTVKFEPGAATGSQKWTQITRSGTVFDLTTNNHAGGAYSPTSLTGTLNLNWSASGLVILDC